MSVHSSCAGFEGPCSLHLSRDIAFDCRLQSKVVIMAFNDETRTVATSVLVTGLFVAFGL